MNMHNDVIPGKYNPLLKGTDQVNYNKELQ